MEDILKEVQKVSENVDKMNTASENNNKAVNDKLDAQHKEVESIKVTLKENSDTIENVQSQVRELADKATKTSVDNKNKSFNDHLTELVAEKMDDIRKAANGSGETRIGQMKAVGDMSNAANFTDSELFTRDVRNTLIEVPENKVYISDILLQGKTNGTSVTYPKESGGEGGADVWFDKATDKAQMDFDLASQTAAVHWIAGYVIFDREMLDDIAFFNSWLRSKMLRSLKKGRDNFCLNGVTDTTNAAKSVDGLLDVATAYTATAGLADNPVNRIIDSGYGQIIADTEGDYEPTHTVLHPRSAVRIGLNQASGSGEYDLPAGSVGFVNGKLNIGGVDVLRSTAFAQNDFLTFDKNAAMYINRMLPELVVFVDAALAKRNKIMLRIEERGTLAIFNNSAVVKGTLATTP